MEGGGAAKRFEGEAGWGSSHGTMPPPGESGRTGCGRVGSKGHGHLTPAAAVDVGSMPGVLAGERVDHRSDVAGSGGGMLSRGEWAYRLRPGWVKGAQHNNAN